MGPQLAKVPGKLGGPCAKMARHAQESIGIEDARQFRRLLES